MATQAEVGEHLGIAQQSVADLVRRKIIPRGRGRGDLDIDVCRLRYIDHLREVAAGRLGEGDNDLDLVAERARLAKESADRLSMMNDITRRSVVRVVDVIKVLGASLSQLRTRLLAFPSEAAVALHRCKSPAEVQDRLGDMIYDLLTELSSPEAYADAASDEDDMEFESGREEGQYHDVVDLDPWEPVVKAIYAAMEAARLASAQTFHEAGC